MQLLDEMASLLGQQSVTVAEYARDYSGKTGVANMTNVIARYNLPITVEEGLTWEAAREKELLQELSLRGLDLNKVMLSSFYPAFRERIMESWQRLFRHHQALLQGDCSGVGAVQAALWCIRREWVLQR